MNFFTSGFFIKKLSPKIKQAPACLKQVLAYYRFNINVQYGNTIEHYDDDDIGCQYVAQTLDW